MLKYTGEEIKTKIQVVIGNKTGATAENIELTAAADVENSGITMRLAPR